jgi:segregation and condensation protein A
MGDMAVSQMNKDLQLENFEGPLHVLLELIEAEEMPITDVSLAHVTEQFLTYLEDIEQRLPEELADFLVVATKLLLLKSRALLPFLEIEEEENPDELAAQLRMYKKYAEATKGIEERLMGAHMLFGKKPSKKRLQAVEFHPPEGVGTQELRDLYVTVLQKLEPVVRIPKAAMKKVVTLREKLSQIQTIIEHNVTTNFHQLVADSNDAGEVVVTFLAVLELVKQKSVAVHQEDSYGDITLEKVEE